MPLFAARNTGVDEEWIEKLERNNPVNRRALSITRLVAGSPAATLLQNGDIVLAVDGNVVTTFRALEKAVQKPARGYRHDLAQRRGARNRACDHSTGRSRHNASGLLGRRIAAGSASGDGRTARC